MESARVTLYQEEENSLSRAPNINQPVPVHVAGQSVGHAVRAADQQAPSDESADITQFGYDIWDGVPGPVLFRLT